MAKHTAPTGATEASAPKATIDPGATHSRARSSAAPAFARSKKHAPSHAAPRGRLGIVLRSLGLIVLAASLMGGTAFGTIYAKLQSNIEQHEIVRAAPTKPRPAPVVPIDKKAGQPLNILILGSDERPADSGEGVSGMRSDTAMVAHISADRKRIDVISIPRDTLVTIPSCVVGSWDGSSWNSYEQYNAMFNSAFMVGGQNGDVGSAASCTLATIEEMSGVLIDGFVVANFYAFKSIVDTLDGVDMCFNQDIGDTDSGLEVTAGCHTLDGEQALALARARHGIGDGSDLSRIGRQQELVYQLIAKIMKLNVLTDSAKFYQIAAAITQNLDTSQGLGDLSFLAGLAYSLKDIDMENGVHFFTLPIYSDPDDPNRVRARGSADFVWQALREDTPVPASALDEMRTQEEVVVNNRQPVDPPAEEETTDSTDGETSDSGETPDQ